MADCSGYHQYQFGLWDVLLCAYSPFRALHDLLLLILDTVATCNEKINLEP
jgi:hypothetical protein